MDLNFETIALVEKCLRYSLEFKKTDEYFHEVADDIFDARSLVNGKKDPNVFETYTQVFDDKHGFINNLSVLDLIFNEGKFALDYLKNPTKLPFVSLLKLLLKTQFGYDGIMV